MNNELAIFEIHFLSRLFGGEVTVIIYIRLNHFLSRLFGSHPKQLCYPLLCKPNGFTTEQYFYFYLAISGGIK